MTRKRTLLILAAWGIVSAFGLLALEAITLSDTVPGNHITAVARWAWDREPWVVLWLMCSLSFLAGHFFAGSKE